MKVKSLLVAGTMVAGLGVSVFSLPTYAAGTAINTGNIATYSTGTDAYTLPAGDYELGSNLDLGTGVINIEGAVTLNFGNYKITAANIMVPAGASLTLSGDGGVVGSITSNGILTINGGIYDTTSGWGAPLNVNAGTLTVSSGRFKAGGSSAAYIMSDVNAIITGGDFTSNGDHGIEADGNAKMNISGGTFTGSVAGIIMPSSATLTLAGGTFNYTDTVNGHGALAILNGEVSAFTSFLADGYEYSDATASVKDWYGISIARLSGSSVTVHSKTTTTENKSTGGTEKVIAKATSNGSTKKIVKAPNTGAVDGAVAAEGLTVLTMATLSGLAFIKKKF